MLWLTGGLSYDKNFLSNLYRHMMNKFWKISWYFDSCLSAQWLKICCSKWTRYNQHLGVFFDSSLPSYLFRFFYYPFITKLPISRTPSLPLKLNIVNWCPLNPNNPSLNKSDHCALFLPLWRGRFLPLFFYNDHGTCSPWRWEIETVVLQEEKSTTSFTNFVFVTPH